VFVGTVPAYTATCAILPFHHWTSKSPAHHVPILTPVASGLPVKGPAEPVPCETPFTRTSDVSEPAV
jgi:hypothetical protein